MHYDVICISDLHLGAKNSQTKRLRRFLHKLKKGKHLSAEILIIVGDAFEKQKEKPLRKRDRKVIKLIRKIAKKIRVIDLIGNHDLDPEFNKKHFCVEVMEEFVFTSGDKKVYVSHGHQHDKFLDKHPLITNVADAFYNISQQIDPSHSIARLLKKRSKQFLKVAKKIGVGVAQAAIAKGCNMAVHGHNHHAGHSVIDGVDVWDDGCWTEKPCTFWSIKNGEALLHEMTKND